MEKNDILVTINNVRSDADIFADSDLRGLSFVGFMEEIRSAVDKEVDVFDITHIEKGSKIEKEMRCRL